jgi:hypothetical protein
MKERKANRNGKEATAANQADESPAVPEPEPANRRDRAGTTALVWPWHIRPGQHIRPIVLEAMEILKSEGWVIGRILDPDIPFDLIGILDRAAIFVKAVKAKCPVRNAAETARTYYHEIRKMQPFWNRDGDNLQLWVFSRVAGLLRYRVYRGGIWNEAARPKPELVPAPVDTRMRNAS